MKKFWKDAASLLGFPWSKPAKPTTRATTSSGFVQTISDTDFEEMAERNQAAHAITSNVAADTFTEFTIVDGDGEELEEFNKEVQAITAKYITQPIIRAMIFARAYGCCGILIGYADSKTMSTPVARNPQITYLQPIPKPWIEEINLKKDKDGNVTLPLELASYDISFPFSQQTIDATRLVHLRYPGLKEESLEGESVLRCIYDDLTVLKSMTWGAGQAMWRHGGGMTVFIAPDSADPQTQIDAIDEVSTDLNAMTTLTMPPGTEVVSGKTGALNPKEYFDTCLQMISIGSRIPQSILRGSVAGSLTASEKDRKDYFELLDNIQKELLTPALTDILHRFQASGQLPQQEEFLIKWIRTPIWMLEEQRGKKLQAETAYIELQTEELRNTANLKG